MALSPEEITQMINDYKDMQMRIVLALEKIADFHEQIKAEIITSRTDVLQAQEDMLETQNSIVSNLQSIKESLLVIKDKPLT